MSSKKRASLSGNSPLDQLFGPSRQQEEEAEQPEAPPAAPATAPEVAAPEVAPEPPAPEPSLRQTTIMIYDDQSTWLDDVCYFAKRDSGSNVSKAAIIRALVDLAREHDVNLAGTESDQEIKERLRDAFGLR